MQYNTQQKRMPLPEYGRSIHGIERDIVASQIGLLTSQCLLVCHAIAGAI